MRSPSFPFCVIIFELGDVIIQDFDTRDNLLAIGGFCCCYSRTVQRLSKYLWEENASRSKDMVFILSNQPISEWYSECLARVISD